MIVKYVWISEYTECDIFQLTDC